MWLPFGLIWGRALVFTRIKLPLVSILSPSFPSQKCFLRCHCTASHPALLRSSLPEHLQLPGASHAQRALPLLQYLWQLALRQRPRTKAAASLPWTERDLLVSGSGTLCPWEGCSAETRHAYSLLTSPADLLSACALLSVCPWLPTPSFCWDGFVRISPLLPLFPSLTLISAGRRQNLVFIIQLDRHDP